MDSRFEIVATPIDGLKLIQRKQMRDSRGYLERLYCADEFRVLLSEKGLLQINRISTAKRGAVRGMHFQHPPYAEKKIISCIKGAVFDVAVDLRLGSPTFLHWHAELLTAENHRSFLVPEGFAHGVQTVAKDCELLYLHTAIYSPDAEGGINARDPKLKIQWPQSITELSARDSQLPFLAENYPGLSI